MAETHQPRSRLGVSNYVFAVLGAMMFAAAIFIITVLEDMRIERKQRSQLISMTNSFVSVFAQNRGENAPVPATFRRLGIEHFSNSNIMDNSETRTTVRMPGLPGLELATVEQNERLRQIIRDFQETGNFVPIEEHRLESGRLIGRTIYPSVANNQSCVECHNRIFDSEIFKLDDVMGAFIVESDLSPHALRNLKYAIGAFFVALAGFLMLTSRERKRMKEIVLGLRARVRLEKLKREAEEREVFLRSHDSLTGLPNRAMLMDRLDKDMVASKHAPVILALVDVDDFKLVNDELGHAAGDALLIEIANRLQHIAKSANGLAARLGGDEFAVTIEPSDDMASPNALGAALKAIFAENFQFEHNRIQPKCSIGISCTSDIIGRSRSELLKAADSALYEAKAKGKNTFQVFNEEIKESIVRRDHLAARLPTAIRTGEISVALQPKLCLETGTLAGFEALARWTCDGERIAPIEFVGIAETIGIIRELDLAVLKAAAEFSVGEKNRNGREVPISANICALHFRAGSLIADVERILNLTGLDPKLLTLEITESVVVENWDRALKTFEALRRWGVRISLDDFGTGYSSLSYLRSLKFEEIKIDREFVVDIATNPDTKFIFDNIVNLAHGLGSTIVVEGIETEVQARIVKAANACVGQGYLFGRPFSVEQAKTFMSALDRMAA